jgi:SNF2 family DNA or RNA helicase
VEDTPIRTEVEDVFILCLDAALAHGLDLSFVTHLFLLKPINDAALLEQVTSRAHRLGSTGPVTVKTVNVWPEMNPETEKAGQKLT